MKINVHIERLVLDGLRMDWRQGRRVQQAVAGELARLLSNERVQPRLGAGGTLASINGGSIEAEKLSDPSGTGTAIAAAVYSGLGERR